jgi:hypothetical protein
VLRKRKIEKTTSLSYETVKALGARSLDEVMEKLDVDVQQAIPKEALTRATRHYISKDEVGQKYLLTAEATYSWVPPSTISKLVKQGRYISNMDIREFDKAGLLGLILARIQTEHRGSPGYLVAPKVFAAYEAWETLVLEYKIDISLLDYFQTRFIKDPQIRGVIQRAKERVTKSSPTRSWKYT